MKLVLLSGGSGKRLWPLSNDARSKQFLKVLKDKNGESQSMIQRVWSQLKEAGLEHSTLISTSSTQVDMIMNQLDPVRDLIVEPERRDTFPAVCLAASYLYSYKKVDPNEVIVVLPVDPYVEQQFFNKVKEMEKVLKESNANIALMGVQPTFPSEKYGYIIPKHEDRAPWNEVKYFKEKPSTALAKEFIELGGLWNCGVFAFKLNYMITRLQNMGRPTTFEKLLKEYDSLPKDSMDYAVIEKEKNVVVLKYEGYWKDIGTWNTLTDEMSVQQVGEGIISQDSVNTHLINELHIPVTIIGGSNLVVAASPDGILVSDKEKSPMIKQLLKGDQPQPMYEEKRWGWYKTLEHNKIDAEKEVLTKRLVIHKGKNLSYHMHINRQEVWMIVKGEGEFVLDGSIKRVREGEILEIPARAKHSIRALEDLEIIEVQTGSLLTIEDELSVSTNWEECIPEMNKSSIVI
ncbi:sugar phosphate nucleotidyltransferase [Fictibacillus phosphorivorans]|uniref:sugar phosphate nucleotidyltransferase n=1 Tax=Fictibacillus phosphorivorans TaxID=1221500 RepID=UPI00203E878B|nr:sugar phosphate nucleotidyltransferase [Fictibacillus phosphorivorans]MCM3717686.1 sugar phosphate nucleotidyltransferase [Fictibacillus phosphorivorans]MCM3775586.1 sugar phosphate nucleotidyltransferase [Fictibacillus phosphorivorans]